MGFFRCGIRKKTSVSADKLEMIGKTNLIGASVDFYPNCDIKTFVVSLLFDLSKRVRTYPFPYYSDLLSNRFKYPASSL